jgi:kynurenine formamidase
MLGRGGKKMRGRIGIAALALAVASCGGDGGLPDGRIVDLSHAYGTDTIYWPTDERGFEYETLAAGRSGGGDWYAAGRFATAEHGGTHLDAPVHFGEGRASVDEIPLERLVGRGVLVDVEAACAVDPDYRVRVQDLLDWEHEHGRIPAGAIVLLRTGWAARWGDRARYLGTEAAGPDAVTGLHFPGLEPDAARWLAEQREIAAVGLDTPSIDHGPSRRFETHRILAEAGIPAFENLASLSELPPTGFSVVALPMKIAGGTGAPLRAVALLPW